MASNTEHTPQDPEVPQQSRKSARLSGPNATMNTPEGGQQTTTRSSITTRSKTDPETAAVRRLVISGGITRDHRRRSSVEKDETGSRRRSSIGSSRSSTGSPAGVRSVIKKTRVSSSSPVVAVSKEGECVVRLSPVTKSDSGGSRKRSLPGKDAPVTGVAGNPPPEKKRRTVRLSQTGEETESDYYCWVCHKEGKVICCELCPRVYHLRCLGLEREPVEDWVCPECEKIMRAECTDTRSKAMEMISVDVLCILLKYALQRMKHQGSEPFQKAVDSQAVPTYTDYIFNPMDLGLLEKNIKKKMYGSTEAFLSDAKWILHNCIIFNGTHHKLTSSAKMITKICKHEMNEIEICPDCYLNSVQKRKDNWFCEPCRTPHTLVWAKLKGYPFWPAKALRVVNGQVDVRFFGAHDRAWVQVSQVYMLSEEPPTPVRNKKGAFEESMDELQVHINRIKHKFGSFNHAAFKTPYHPENPYNPGKGRVGTDAPKKKLVVTMVPLGNAEREVTASPGVTTGIATPSREEDTAPRVHLLKDLKVSNEKSRSILAKTASAVKNKYSSIIKTRRSRDASNAQSESVTEETVTDTPEKRAQDTPEKDTESEAKSGTSNVKPGVFEIEDGAFESEKEGIKIDLNPVLPTLKIKLPDKSIIDRLESKIEKIKQAEEAMETDQPQESQENIAIETKDSSKEDEEVKPSTSEEIKETDISLPEESREESAQEQPEEPIPPPVNPKNTLLKSLVESCKARVGATDDEELDKMDIEEEDDDSQNEEETAESMTSIESEEVPSSGVASSVEEDTSTENPNELTEEPVVASAKPNLKTPTESKSDEKETLEEEDDSSSSTPVLSKISTKSQSETVSQESPPNTKTVTSTPPVTTKTTTVEESDSESEKLVIDVDKQEETSQKKKAKSPIRIPVVSEVISQKSNLESQDPEESWKQKKLKRQEKKFIQDKQKKQQLTEVNSQNKRQTSVTKPVKSTPPVPVSKATEVVFPIQPFTKTSAPQQQSIAPASSSNRGSFTSLPNAGGDGPLRFPTMDFSKYSEQVMQTLQGTFESLYQEVVNSKVDEMITKHFQLELERLKWKHQMELAELRHNAELTLVEMRASLESEKQQAMTDVKKLCEKEKRKAIEETKKKQWCANCGKEAIFYCCWNTSYCDYPCQQSHWPNHMSQCTQSQGTTGQDGDQARQSGQAPETNQRAVTIQQSPDNLSASPAHSEGQVWNEAAARESYSVMLKRQEQDRQQLKQLSQHSPVTAQHQVQYLQSQLMSSGQNAGQVQLQYLPQSYRQGGPPPPQQMAMGGMQPGMLQQRPMLFGQGMMPQGQGQRGMRPDIRPPVFMPQGGRPGMSLMRGHVGYQPRSY